MKKNLFKILFLLFLIIIPLNANADHLIGISTFSIKSKNFDDVDCDHAIKMALTAKNPAIAVLFKTFGDERECIERFWKEVEEKGKQHITEIHFSNEAGRRNGNLSKTDFLTQYNVKQYNKLLIEMPRWLKKEIKLRVREIKKLVKKGRKNGYIILSTGLEDNYKAEAWYNLYNEIKKYWPYAIARSAANIKHKKWVAPDNVWDERHSYNVGPYKENRCILNGDGQDVDFLKYSGQYISNLEPASYKKVKKWIRNGLRNNCIIFIWAGKWQGLVLNKKASNPLKRKAYFQKHDVPIIQTLIKRRTHKNIETLPASEILTY